jgi:hypothetical protein
MLVVPDGVSKRVGVNGLLIGRQKDCDIVAVDPSVSRRHALVRLTSQGAEIVPLGRAPVEVNAKAYTRAHELCDGDEITLPGLTLAVQITAQRPGSDEIAGYRLERPRGGSFGIVHSPFVIGGDESDDLIVKRWPAHALVLRLAQGELFVEVTAGKATCNGREIAPGTLDPLVAGDELVYRKEAFTVRRTNNHDATTALGGIFGLPTRVTIEMLPRGGRVVFAMSDGDHPVFLHDRRLDLVIALLRPPQGYSAGDFIPDDVVSGVVWPRSTVSRVEINTLISRCRKDLLEAGLSGPRLVQRAPGGGGTRFALAPGAEVIVLG